MAYEKIGFTDEVTPLDMENFNHMEDGIAANADDIENLNADLTDIDMFGNGTEISSGADLNDYMTAGKYYSRNSTVTASLVNCPARGGGISLYVMILAGNTSQVTQVLFINNSSRMFLRYLNSSGEGSWVQVSTTEVSTSSVGDPVVMGDEDSVED